LNFSSKEGESVTAIAIFGCWKKPIRSASNEY